MWLEATCPDVWHVDSHAAKWGSYNCMMPSRKHLKHPNFEDKKKVHIYNYSNNQSVVNIYYICMLFNVLVKVLHSKDQFHTLLKRVIAFAPETFGT